MKYYIWYRKEVEAKNIKSAILKEPAVMAEFHSVEIVKDETEQGMSAIGFETEPDESFYNPVCLIKEKKQQ